MIIDNLKNCEMYYALHKDFEKAFNFIKDYLKNPIENGTYEIDGNNVYALVMDCDLKEEGKLETHKKYIDIQFIVDGVEYMSYTNKENVKVTEDLLDEKDVMFYEKNDKLSKIKFYKNDFAIYFPQDAHEPCLIADNNKTSKKIVVKVKF